jgi:hypothetical protein
VLPSPETQIGGLLDLRTIKIHLQNGHITGMEFTTVKDNTRIPNEEIVTAILMAAEMYRAKSIVDAVMSTINKMADAASKGELDGVQRDEA